MATIDDVIQDVRVFVKNCPDLTIKYALRRAVQEFCRESWIYQQTVQLTPVANQEVYPLDLSIDRIIDVKAVQYNSVALVNRRGVDAIPSPLNTGGTQPYEYIFEPPNLLMLQPVPNNITNPTTNTPYDLFVRLVLSPTDSKDHVPEVIYRNYKQQLAAGAIAYCMFMPQEVWSNPEAGMMFNTTFRYGYNEAKRRQMFGSGAGGTRVRPRSFLMGG